MPSTNGHAPAPAPPPRPDTHALPPKPPAGRVAAAIRPRERRWFAHPWVPLGSLSLVVGLPSTGKSSFLAWLASRAKRTVILPGYEEEVDQMLLPRLKANHVDLSKVLILDDRRYAMLTDKAKIMDAVFDWGADLVVIDPIDSYQEEGSSENESMAVRLLLEACHALAAKCECAVIAARHPGKRSDNILPGSRQWFAVPKTIIEVVKDLGPPARRLLRSYRDAFGVDPNPQEYCLIGPEGEARRFELGAVLDTGAADRAKLAIDERDRVKSQEATDFLRQILTDGEQEAGWILAEARKLGLGETTMYEAAHRLQVGKRKTGFGRESKRYWTPPAAWPDAPGEAPAEAP